jgi:arabinose-5-phosphate isomerase
LSTEAGRSISPHDKVVELLQLESSAIERATKMLDPENVRAAVELIADCESKVVVTGVGKSGVIAQKIAQTLTSTGTIAVFVHPSDALHGGFGVVTTGDVLIALSNSGETDEIVSLLPAIARRGPKLIAIVGNLDSTLARKADVVLDASVDKEACPLNLAPTTSTTVALAIGDALAMTAMEVKGLTAEDFAANHPAGRLGKRLTVTVGDLMHESPNIAADADWLDVVRAISKHALGAVNVLDKTGALIGIVTDGDLRRTIERTPPEKLSELSAVDMMTRSPITTSAETMAYEALKMMEDRPSQISVLPVVDVSGRAVGLLRLHDIVKTGL